MRNTLPLLFLLGLPLLAQAQANAVGRDRFGNPNFGYGLIPPGQNEVKGTPFLLPGWQPATLLLADETAPQAAVIKYDTYRQEVRAKLPKGDSVLVPLAKLREFALTGTGAPRRFVCLPAAQLPAGETAPCAEVLADGPQLQLLKFWRKKLVKKQDESSSYATYATQNVLEEQTSYALRWPADGHLTPLRLKRNSLEQALAGQPAALSALAARKGSLGSETEMAAAIAVVQPLLGGAAH